MQPQLSCLLLRSLTALRRSSERTRRTALLLQPPSGCQSERNLAAPPRCLARAIWACWQRERQIRVGFFCSSFSFYRPADRRPLLKHKSLLTNGCLPLVTKWCVDEETEREAGLALAVCLRFNPEQRADLLMNEKGSSRDTRTRYKDLDAWTLYV